jgi:hypothetical protein
MGFPWGSRGGRRRGGVVPIPINALVDDNGAPLRDDNGRIMTSEGAA